MIDYMQKGGPLMWLILFCSVLAGAVFLERVTYFHRATIRVGEFMRGLGNLCRAQLRRSPPRCAGTPGPVARVIHSAVLRHDAPRSELKDIVQEAGQLEVPRLERRLGILATIACIAPLIGLLGTVTGLIDAFVNLSTQSGYASTTDIAGGIYQSLPHHCGRSRRRHPVRCGLRLPLVPRELAHALTWSALASRS
jgi:biopolymer transport protein ExbB